MKRERAEPAEMRILPKRHHNQQRINDEQPPKQGFKASIAKSLSERVYDQLDWLSRYLNQKHGKNIQQSTLVQIKEMFMLVSDGMSLQQVHNLQYPNRLFYIKRVIERRKSKQKNWERLTDLITDEISRIEKLYDNYLNDYSFLTILKQKYSQPFAQMPNISMSQ